MKSFQFLFFLVLIILIALDYLYSPNIKINDNSLYNKTTNCAPCGAPCEIINK